MPETPSKSRFLPRFLIVPALALLAAGCKPAAAPGGPGGFPPPVVTVAAVEPKDLAVNYEYPAQTAGYREVEVRARVTGILERRNYQEGALVKQGQSLFTIDPAPFRVALARAEADIAVADARLSQARREVARLRPVIEARAISQKEFDDAVSAEQVADAEVKSARARVNEAKLNLEYTRVEAPITGATSRSVVSEGTLVSGPSVLLTTVTQTDPIYVIFGIPDREYLALRRDVEAGRLKLPQHGRFQASLKRSDGKPYGRSGAVNFTDVRVNAQTGTIEARAEFANPDGALRAGEFVRVVLQGAVRPGAIVVPQRAVLEGPKGKFVYVADAESKAEARPVEVGDWAGAGWIVNAGLKPGERIIVDGVLKLGPGAPVKIAEGKAEQPAGAQPAQPSAAASGAVTDAAKGKK
ncbi:MAG: efflux RND transporter periplasmic adaptor subunit [Betaproteobacteria bacterium]|nr:efflux RND transporter periplasmic adaptor subunit [Betaproteobacteria bacterium]